MAYCAVAMYVFGLWFCWFFFGSVCGCSEMFLQDLKLAMAKHQASAHAKHFRTAIH
jgi:hypothetical protein